MMENSDATAGVQTDPGVTDFDPNLSGDQVNEADVQSQAGDNEIGPSNVPPELEETRRQLLRDYHAKTQKLAEERGRIQTELESAAQKAEVLEKLMQKEWFQRASQEEQKRLAGGGVQFELTDEQFQQATTDKQAFKGLITNMAQQMLNAQVGPALGQTNEALAQLQTERELDSAIQTYPEIQNLIDSDDPSFLRDCDMYGYETAYEKYAFRNNKGQPTAETSASPEEIAAQSRAGAVSRGGMTQARGNRVIKAKDFDSAFDQAFEALTRGEKDFTFDRS